LRGRSLTQELGHGWWEGIHPEDLARRRAAFAQAVAERSTVEIDYRLRHADGEFRSVHEVVAATLDAAGGTAGLVGACLPQTPPSPSGDASSAS
jgi:PAS domain-containing protein